MSTRTTSMIRSRGPALACWVPAAAILTPGHPRTKEWAYAGPVFVYGGAATSHMAAGDGPEKWAMPLFFAAATFAARARLPQGGSTTTEQRSGSRLPDPRQLVPELGEIGAALFKATGNGAIPRPTISLVQLRAGQIVGSTYLAICTREICAPPGNPKNASPRWRPGVTPPTSPGPNVPLALIGQPLPGRPPAEQWTPVPA